MIYSVELSKRFEREFRKLDRYTQKLIKAWIDKHLEGCSDPRTSGKALSGELSGLWRYRIGDYRLICMIEDGRLVILALSIGRRSEIYTKVKK